MATFTKQGQKLLFEVTIVNGVPMYRVERTASGTAFRFSRDEWQEFMQLISAAWKDVQDTMQADR